jgi:YidC/Oxa1 family membrane protein insertase
MNNTRLIFIVMTAVLAMMLASQWQIQNAQRNAPVTAAPTASATVANAAPAEANDGSVPSAPANVPADASVPAVPVASSVAATAVPEAPGAVGGARVNVETDLFKLELSLAGADIVSAKLKTYSVSVNDRTPIELVSDRAQQWIKMQSGLAASGTVSLPNHLTDYVAPSGPLVLAEGSNTLEVPFTWTDANGISVKKIYSFTRGSFAIGVRYEISNGSAQPLNAFAYRQLSQPEPAAASSSFFASPAGLAYAGAAIYSPDERFEKIDTDRFVEEPLKRSFAGGWMALLQHHFFVAWIPDAKETNDYSTVVLNGQQTTYLSRQQTPLLAVAPGATQVLPAKLYIGPKLQNDIAKLAPGLETVVDYGMFTIFSAPLFKAMNWFHSLTNNWGFAIILIVLALKLIFYKLSAAQYRSGAKMKAIAPKIEELKRRLGSDPQKFGMAQMELFRKEGVNPFLGCLPVLIQIPVFLGLYWVLAESVEMRQAPFLGWIKDLTAADPYFVLPVLNCLVMFLTSKMTPMTGMDPLQQKMLQYMPLMFGVMMAFFPSGLVLYWTFNGVLGLAQQWWITSSIETEMAAKK